MVVTCKLTMIYLLFLRMQFMDNAVELMNKSFIDR